MHWQVDSKSGALSIYALNFYFTMMALDNSIGHSQTQAYSFYFFLGRKEGSEQLAQVKKLFLKGHTGQGSLVCIVLKYT